MGILKEKHKYLHNKLTIDYTYSVVIVVIEMDRN